MTGAGTNVVQLRLHFYQTASGCVVHFVDIPAEMLGDSHRGNNTACDEKMEPRKIFVNPLAELMAIDLSLAEQVMQEHDKEQMTTSATDVVSRTEAGSDAEQGSSVISYLPPEAT